MSRQPDDAVTIFVEDGDEALVAFGDDGDDTGSAGLGFLNVVRDLLEERVVESERDELRAAVDSVLASQVIAAQDVVGSVEAPAKSPPPPAMGAMGRTVTAAPEGPMRW